ncbi:MAG TPA: D-glycero-beta-D-manno-heptose-7-phosphate kinase [Cyanobacteria bacterium UBA8530]|nr:D-glycero-beta-D-manno-heptose-7-phosphate kinase [Cyanobacteria bacterium UBA8530]
MKGYIEKARFEAITSRFPRTRLLVVGDAIADEFLVGEPSRISREAPVLILKHKNSEIIPGGAGNAAANAASLGGRVDLLGAVGQDLSCDRLREALEVRGVGTKLLLPDPSRPTTTKTRISAHSQQSVTQQIVRIDKECHLDLSPELEARAIAFLEAAIPEVDAVLVSDYGNGVLTKRIVERLGSLCLEHHKKLTVDSQAGLGRFPHASVITPNQPEAEAAVGYKIEDRESLLRAGADLLSLSGAEAALITRGANGIALFERSETSEVPAFNRSEVFDVTGAGDTVIATFTLALAAGATFLEATVLANLAASIVVRRFGTATTTVAEMAETYRRLSEKAAF